MILELCVIAGVQIGYHYYRKRRARQAPPVAPAGGAQPPIAPPETVDPRALAGLAAPASPAESAPTAAPAPDHRRGVAISAASLGLAVVTSTSPLSLLSTGAISYTIAPLLRRSWTRWREDLRVTNDVLFTLFSVLALTLRCNTAIAFSYLAYELGSLVLDKASAKARTTTFDGIDQLPRTVWLVKDGVQIEVPLAEIAAGDIVVVASGELVPVDGRVTKGHALVDQQLLTGEAQPAEKQVDDPVMASTLVTAGRIWIEVSRTGRDTNVARIAKTLIEIAHAKTEVQLKGEQIADRIALPTLAIAGAALVGSGLPMAIVMLNSSFGNRIRVLSPISTLNYLTIAARRGVLVKSGAALERIQEVDTVLFDKTGTLTLPALGVGRITRYGAFDEAALLAFAAAAEQRQKHPIAKAILEAARDRGVELPACDEADYHIGYGVVVRVASGERVRVGSVRFMEMEGVAQPEAMVREVEEARAAGESVVVVAVDDRVEGALIIEPRVRPEAPAIMRGLRERGLDHLAIVSGDHAGPTRALADALGVDDCFAEVLPTEKADIVKAFQAQGRVVCFIGDGVNDAVAMQQADVSVSLSGATTIATDSASIVLMDGTLRHLCDLVDIARKLDTNVRRSLGLLAASSVVNVGGALFFGLGIGGSVMVKAISSLAAIGNSTLPLIDETEPSHEEREEA
ncbi:MAG: heavy metal translocating P-type ATPase [Myxococcales bacterium]|nr:heavy metal translocating P-type ATPase [Myxococcales bacterium]